MQKSEIIHWLREARAARLEDLYRLADETRRRNVGDAVHLRGLIEISNYCVRDCAYCGLRAGHRALTRYRMNTEEILACVRKAADYGYGTVVLQSGEDYGIAAEIMTEVVRRIKSETDLAVTLSLGERPDADLACWRAAGADRYLLRFETSDAKLYRRIHPPLAAPHIRPEGSVTERSDRIMILRRLSELGYEVGGGVMIGIPGQTYESLTEDIEMFRTLDLDMIGVGPYLPHPDTPLGRSPGDFRAPESDQVPNSEEMTYKVLALARLACPRANIPSTTALATLNTAGGRELGLQRGANVVMPNLTPLKYRALYEIYPGKACIAETAEACQACLRQRIVSIGRKVGTGPGGSVKRRSAPVVSPA